MRATLRQMRRAPIRIATSVVAIALAIAAMGVFAVPGVAESSLRDVAAIDHLTHLHIETTAEIAEPSSVLAELATVDGVETVEGRTTATTTLLSGEQVRVLGTPAGDVINSLRLETGRQPIANTEIIAAPGLAELGDELTIAEVGKLEVVGIGDTTYWADSSNVVYTLPDTAQAITGVHGVNNIVARLDNPSPENLEAAIAAFRGVLGDHGVSFADYITIANGTHPIEEDITQVSFMIGSLGVVAGIVALVLLASTANAVVTERSRDAAILRALGASRREVRKDLRRLAIMIGAIGTLVGLPLGVLVANLIARMVLTRFAGISPEIGLDVSVMLASVVFGVLGARIVSGRVARRIVKVDLAVALRDSEAVPFGSRFSDRVLTRVRTGGLVERIAIRSIARRKSRGVAVAAQFGGAVAAAVLVASLGASITDFNSAELASFKWEQTTSPADPVYPYPLGRAIGPEAEVAIQTWGDTSDGWDIQLFGVDPATVMIDTTVTSGSWLPAVEPSRDLPSAVLATRFAEQEGHAVGDVLAVELASGLASYEIVGLHPIKSVAAFVNVEVLAIDVGSDNAGNTVWTIGDAVAPVTPGVTTSTVDRAALFQEDGAARDAILAIFAAIGTIVVAIAALGAASSVAMNLYERRSEVATLQALGARRTDVRRMIMLELALLAAAGWTIGSVAGYFGASAIIGFFATANAVDLGFTMAWAAVPIAGATSAFLVWILACGAARQAQRHPTAATLRAAT